jgi:integrase
MKGMRAFLTHAQEHPHVFVFSIIMLNTLARPDGVFDLRRAQVDLQDRFIELNPKGRKQTKKYRLIVPITDTLLPFLAGEGSQGHFVLWQGKPVKSVKKAFAETVRHAKLSPKITPYSLRRIMATELRRQGVSPWEVEGMVIDGRE